MKLVKLYLLSLIMGTTSIYSNTSTLNESATMSMFLTNVTLTSEGLAHFYRCYNHPFYVRRFLPSCFLHITDLLQYAQGMSDPHAYTQKIFSLFLERFNGCTWDNPYALAQLLKSVPSKLSFLFDLNNRALDEESLYTAIRATVQNNVAALAKDPSALAGKLSSEIFAMVQTERNRLLTQGVIVRFVDNALSKLIWDPEEKRNTWDSFKCLGSQLELLYSEGILSEHETLNHLLWSLIYRYSYFIELWGSALAVKDYDQMLEELSAIHFLHYGEQEEAITKKAEALTSALNMGKAKALAYNKGILS